MGALQRRTLALARVRLRELALLNLALAPMFYLFFGLVGFQFKSSLLTLELTIIVLTAMAIDVALILINRDPQVSDEDAVTFGLVHHVMRCALMALPTRLEAMLGFDPPAITLGYALVLAFQLFVPLPPRKALLAALLATMTQPIAIVAFAPRAVQPAIYWHYWTMAAVIVTVAVLCGRVAYALRAGAARGEELGAYHLIQLLERERTSEVWRATHRLLARPAAITIVRPSLFRRAAATKMLRRFEEDAQISAMLTSPHTTTLYDYGVSETGFVYAATELLNGENLAARIARTGPLALDEALRAGIQVCDSLGEAHARGLVHGHLAPERVLLCHIGRRLDFVKVRMPRLAELLELEATRDAAFTPPELARGEEATARSDIHQIGGLLYFMVAGHPADTAPQRDGGGATSPLAFADDRLPEAFRETVGRCLAHAPDDRFGSVAALEAALRRLLDELSANPTERRADTQNALHEIAPRKRKRHRDAGRTPRARSSGERVTVADVSFLKERSVMKAPSAVSPEILEAARDRLQKFAVVAAGLTLFATAVPLASDELLRRAPAFGNVLAAVSLALALDLVLYVGARDRGLSIHAVMNLAVGYFVVRVAVLSFGPVRAYLDLDLDPPAMTFGTLLVALLPLFVPKRPEALLLPSILAAAMHPLALVWLTPSGSPVTWPMAAANAGILLIASVYLAHVLTRQRLAASQERAFGDYRLTALIGQGAMGEVWRAEHDLLVRPAAIKLVIPRGITREDQAAAHRRFEREARVTALLTSPHTVTLYDYGSSDEGACYSVMELLEGEDLQRRVQRAGPLSPQQTVSVALQVCDSLAEAHERGLVHRDLKPANLFMARIGCDPHFVKVLDFGFAELIRRLRVAGDASTPATVRVAGTPAFMAPETLLEEEVDARADLYQLACTLFYLLTGHLVFERPSAVAMVLAQVHEPAPPVSTRTSQPIPPDLEAIIARCLEKQPKDRFRSAEALAVALRKVRFDSTLPRGQRSLPAIEHAWLG